MKRLLFMYKPKKENNDGQRKNGKYNVYELEH